MSRTYRAWKAMVQRCSNPSRTDWPRYGGRGIRVCDRWRKFENFLADMGACPDGLTLDRIDNSGNYEPGNCRWTTWQVQYANRRSNSGELHPNAKLTADDVGQIRELNARGMTQRQLGERYGVSHTTIGYILQRKAWRTRTHAAGRSSLSLEL